MAGLAVALASILAFLYVRTQDHDDSRYFENVTLLRQLKQLDARWELDVLKSKIGINTNYDSLVDPLFDLNQWRDKLQTVVPNQQHATASALANGSEAFHRAIQEKTRLIEHFKSHNSILLNSLVFLPTAANDVQQAVSLGDEGDQSAPRQVSAGVNKVLLDSMVYSQAPSEGKAAEIQIELNHLAAGRGNLPVAVSGGLDIFAAHVRTVLREQPVVNGLLNSIAAVPTAARIDDLDSLLSSEQQEAGLQARQYRQYLLIFAAALVGLLVYAAVSLIRSHAVINRINKALQGTNATLEQRVQERTRELRAAQSELVTTARQAGKAEIATNVLHNVGNVLNSVNVSATLVTDSITKSRVSGLAKAVALLQEHEHDLGDYLSSDPRGKLLPAYLAQLSEHLQADQQASLKELKLLGRNIEHIKEIVAMQQAYAGASNAKEVVNVRDLVEEALRVNPDPLLPRNLEIVREIEDVPPACLDKHNVLQILVNLMSNAMHACDDSARTDKRMTLRVGSSNGWINVVVIDNGVGIPVENLTKIFSHGFTTKKNGHGFGLHSAALTAKQMGGSLRAQSDGFGQGATFTLELPFEPSRTLS